MYDFLDNMLWAGIVHQLDRLQKNELALEIKTERQLVKIIRSKISKTLTTSSGPRISAPTSWRGTMMARNREEDKSDSILMTSEIRQRKHWW